MTTLASSSKVRLAGKMAASLVVPSLPVLFWWKTSVDDRRERAEEVRTKIRIPNVQTIDDLIVEKCKPGDVLLFDRRCHKCAAGPMAALSCLVARGLLCGEDKGGIRSVEVGSFDHCGVVVPGDTENKAQAADPSNLLLLETTASDGVVARPLLTRLEMSQSRSVLLLPLSSPGERRNDEDYEPSDKTVRLQQRLVRNLTAFRCKWVEESEKQNYAGGHSTLGIFGALGYTMNLHRTSPAPVSPSAWLVLSALQEAGAAENISGRTSLETRVEDFLRDHRFNEKDTVHLRPGWKFLTPVIVRETARS
uniref:Uncharacterized protein n=1 Tax=Pseudictyota dubia TaxID=2749911 RepID=A0A7R9Z800_9STRA|mmetsp:Transcript_26859/g.49746  ORF Transcript_26859/g.49746 Transcript_26859/m.49746 type:complete len:307 (+) Transcript_26859:203-1123(+)